MGREEHGRVEEHEVRRGRSRGPKHHHGVPVHVLRVDPAGGRGAEGLGGRGVNEETSAGREAISAEGRAIQSDRLG